MTIANPERSLGTHVFTATGFTDDHAAMRWLLVSLPAEAAKKDERRADTASHKRHGEKAAQAPSVRHPPRPRPGRSSGLISRKNQRERIAELLTRILTHYIG